MPNDCWNDVVLTADEDVITELVNCEFKFSTLVPPPPEADSENGFPAWFNLNWGTKWDRFDYSLDQRGKQGLRISFTTAWSPPVKLFKTLVERYPSLWIRCDWKEEGGYAGVWVCTKRKEGKEVRIKELYWEDLCLEEEMYLFQSETVPTLPTEDLTE